MPIKLKTVDGKNKPNGWLLPVWHIDSGTRIDQVYVTAVAPGASKGPHLHMKRAGRFCCIRGDVVIVTRTDGEYREFPSGDLAGHEIVYVRPGTPCAIYNVGSDEALVINMPSPPWRQNDQDEHPVKDWNYVPED